MRERMVHVVHGWAEWPVGARVVVRRRRPDGYYSDVLGILLESSAAGVRVRAKDGERWVPAGEIAVGKLVPPPPPRRRPRRLSSD